MSVPRLKLRDGGRGASRSDASPQHLRLGWNPFSVDLLNPSRIQPETIDLTGASSREASLRRSFPGPSKRMASKRSPARSSKKSKSFATSFDASPRDMNATHQVRISLRSLDGDMDREILLTPERRSFEFSRASSRPDQKMAPLEDNAWVTSPIVSRDHCRLYVDLPDRAVWLKDLGSTHGTFLNTRRIQDGCSHRVSHGDRIRLGVSVVNGAATYLPKSFEVKFLWENRYDRPVWRPTRFDRDTRPIVTSSMPTPDESPEQLASKTFSVPNDSDSDEESVIIAAETRKVKESSRALAAVASASKSKSTDTLKPTAVKPTGNIEIQVPNTVAGMSQIPIVTFSDSDDDAPESLPILKTPLSNRASKKSTPKPETNEPGSLSTPVQEKSSVILTPSKVTERVSPDYSPAFDNNFSTSQTKPSQKSSQPAEEDLESEDMVLGSDVDDLYNVASEDDWLPTNEDEFSPESDPNRPYGDDAEEAEDEFDDYPAFGPGSGTSSSASSVASASHAASSFQPGQNHSIRVPDSTSSDSEADDDAVDSNREVQKANESEDYANRENTSGQEHQDDPQDAQIQSETRNELDAANVIAMLRTQLPPDLDELSNARSVQHPRRQALAHGDVSLSEPTRFVFGDNFDTLAPVYSPPVPSVPYTQGPFAGLTALETGPVANASIPYIDVDDMVGVEDLRHIFAGLDEPQINSLPVPNNYHTAPEPAAEPVKKPRSTRVSIADIVNAESVNAETSKSAGQKRKADENQEDAYKQSSTMSFYEMDDNSLLHTSGKAAENALDSAAQRQLDREVRAASSDPRASGSRETLPDAQPRTELLLPLEQEQTIDYLHAEDEAVLRPVPSRDEETAAEQVARELAEMDELDELEQQMATGSTKTRKVVKKDDVVDVFCIPDDEDEDQAAEDSEHDDSPPRKKRRISRSDSPPAPRAMRGDAGYQPVQLQPVHSGRRFTWRSFVTGAVTGAAAVLGAAAAIVATVPPEVREEVMREW